MDFWQVLEARYSVRRFDPAADVPPETVERILQAAIRAPSAGNRQPWHFYVVRDAALRSGLAAAAFGQEYVAQAPVAIVVCADAEQSAARYHERGRELYCLQDTAAAATHILLAAVALGLGSCWIGAFDEGQAAAVLELPSRHRPVAILPIGRPAGERGGATSREPLESVATFLG
ncbi:MAG: nitroreductase family protein [Anaerolineaceae bacterium]|nr:nitroreductase family protein [Anaerolineaceae bacterium]